MVRDSSFINLEREAENNGAFAVIFGDSIAEKVNPGSWFRTERNLCYFYVNARSELRD